MNIQIEEAEKKDFPLIINLLKGLYSELGEEKESLEFLNEQLLENIWDSMLTEIFFAKSEDKVIGLLTLTQSQAPVPYSARNDIRNERDKPNTTIDRPNPATDSRSARPAFWIGGRCISVNDIDNAPSASAAASQP